MVNRELIEMAASICTKFEGTGVGIVGGSEEEIAYFSSILCKKRAEKKEEELRKKRKENEKKFRERYRKFLDRVVLNDRLLNLTPNDEIKTLIMAETNKWLKEIC